MTGFTPRDPNYEARIRQSFAKQHFMALIGAELTRTIAHRRLARPPDQLTA